jgi:hypothetical protein
MVFSIAVLTITAMYGVVPAVWQAWERQVSFGGQDKRTASRLVLCGWDDWQILYGKKAWRPYAALNSALFSTQNSMASRP